MCNLMHKGGLDNILQLTLNIFFLNIFTHAGQTILYIPASDIQ